MNDDRVIQLSYTREYRAWQNIKDRCYNTLNKDYRHYGGRGIGVFDGWLHDFKAFYNYVGERPTAKHSIDRIDNDGDYKPGNVKWSTRREQTNNRRVINSQGFPGIRIREYTTGAIRWIARIYIEGNDTYIGMYKSLDEAIGARLSAEESL